MTIIAPADFPLGRLPFSPAVRANGFVFVSGQASTDAAGNVVPDSFAGQFHRAITNIETILGAVGLTLRDVVQVRSYLARTEDFDEYNQLYCQRFPAPFPARTTLVNCLEDGILFEIDVIAAERPPS
jgi:2-iminobutanoate/2-iminopropanoate deaminase